MTFIYSNHILNMYW